MENLFKDLPYVSVYLDDILITGRTQAEHLQNLNEVLNRLSGAGMHLKRDECVFMTPAVEYLGHRITV